MRARHFIALVPLVACGRTSNEPARSVELTPPPAERPVVSAPPVASSSEPASSEPDQPPPEAPPDAGPSYPAVVGNAVVDRGKGPSRHASTESACRACKGSWGPHGMAGQVGCICGTHDAGKACTSPRDCEAECVVDNPDNYRDVRCGPAGCNGPEIVGHCAAYTVSFGCMSRIAEMPYQGGFVREVHSICLD